MNEQMIGILGGLIGSILTVIITKVIDLIQKKNEFQYDLKKQFFSKKIVAAETAMMQYSLFMEATGQLVVLYGNHEDWQKSTSNVLSKNLLEMIEEKAKSASDSSLALSRSIGLYFDFKSNRRVSDRIAENFDKLNQLDPLFEGVENAKKQYFECQGTAKEKLAYEDYLVAEGNLKGGMLVISENYKTLENELIDEMDQIRSEMKKYE